MANSNAASLPIFLGHGTKDVMIKYSWSEITRDTLKTKLGVQDVEYHAYPGMGHSACAEELRDFEAFLRRVLPEDGLAPKI